METFANQKVIKINKPSYTKNYLTVGIDEWVEASKNLSPAAFKIYLYLASNANGFSLALSQKAVYNALDISRSTYHKAVNELEEKEYIVLSHGNTYNFNTSLKNETVKNNDVSKMRPTTPKNETVESQNRDKVVSKTSTEIDNINNTNNNIYNNISPSDEGCIEEICKEIEINYSERTKEGLEKVIGEELDVKVFKRLVEDNMKAFTNHNAKEKGQNYRYTTLVNITRDNYHNTKSKLEAEKRQSAEIRKSGAKCTYGDAAARAKEANKNKEPEIDFALEVMDEILWYS